MLTLAIETSGEVCTLALGRDAGLLSERRFHHKMSLLRRILPNIENMLADARCRASDLDAIIVGLGPGSFTGLRIGVTIAKSLAYGLSRPVVGIGTLDALARSVAPTSAEAICPMIHARANEVYWTVTDCSGTLRLADYHVGTVQQVLEEMAERQGKVHFCGTGSTRNAEAIRHVLGTKAIIGEKWSEYPCGAVLIDLGRSRVERGEFDDTMSLAPIYVRKPTPLVRLESGEL
ncbi:MAG: tRNA (adenosine(37)-N6)-threonylcarbamoyltransferase complex dimerization subunit type 1 TsaB [Armatimonadota bacterium]